MPGSPARISCSVAAGERAISSAVMTLLAAPTMPVPVRLAVTVTSGSVVPAS